MKRLCSAAARTGFALFALASLARSSTAQDRVDAGALELDTPSGFARSVEGDVAVFRPVGPTHACCALTIPPGEATEQPFSDWFDARWAELSGEAASAGVPAPLVDATPEGDARRTIGRGLPDGRGGQVIVFFTAIQRGARVQPFVFIGRPELGMEQHLPAIDAALTSARFRPRSEWPDAKVVALPKLLSIAQVGAAVAPAPSPVQAPGAPGPGGAGGKVLNGVYTGLSLRAVRWDTGGSNEEYAVFFPDGSFFSRLPQDGLMHFDRAASMRESPSFWGTYRVEGPRVLLRYQDGRGDIPATLDASGRLTVENRWTLGPVPPLDGLRLSGAYARAGGDESFHPRPIRFAPDGTFQDAGALDQVGIVEPGGMFATIPAGAGSYRIGRNTLRLEYPTGWLEVSIIVAPDDAASGRPRMIMLNKYRLDLVE